MESKAMPSSLAVLASPRRDAMDAKMLTSLSVPSLQMMVSQTDIEQMLSVANQHVDNAIAAHHLNDKYEVTGADELDMETKKTSVAATVARLVSNAVHTLRRSVPGRDLRLDGDDDARYQRLKGGFLRLQDHVNALACHREQLGRELDAFRLETLALQEAFTYLMESSKAFSATELLASLSESAAASEEMKNVLELTVAKQTSNKVAELERFEKKLEVCEQLRHEVVVAEKQLLKLRSDMSKRSHRATKKHLAAMQEVAAKRQEFQHQRRRLAVMTEAFEHVFQFHYQLDQCIAEPELETVRNQLQHFFQLSQQAFEQLYFK